MPRKTKSSRMGRPPRESWPVCKVEECEKTTKGGCQGMCSTHYMQTRRGMRDVDGNLLRAPKRVSSYGAGARCVVVGCGSRPSGRGLCTKHLQQHQRGVLSVNVPPIQTGKGVSDYNGELCLVTGCDKRPVSRWMCSKHSQQRDIGILDEQGNILRELQTQGRVHLDRPTINGMGYKLVAAPDWYKGRTKDGRVLEHRLFIEQSLGRYLGPHEIVHHINGVKTDNRLQNLQVRTRKAHPPGAESTASVAAQHLEHLKHNNPEAYKLLLKKLRHEHPD